MNSDLRHVTIAYIAVDKLTNKRVLRNKRGWHGNILIKRTSTMAHKYLLQCLFLQAKGQYYDHKDLSHGFVVTRFDILQLSPLTEYNWL